MFLASVLQAESVLMKLPYGLEIGKKIPQKAIDAVKSKGSSEYLEKYKLSVNIIPNRIRFWSTDKHLVTALSIHGSGVSKGYQNSTKLPKLWRDIGLSLATDYSTGTPCLEV